MKNLFVFITFIILLFLPVVLYTKLIYDFEELENEVAVEKVIKDKKIKELEKEIRILKTDMNVIYYGFENEEGK